jgi:hypothetical protein
MGGVEQVESVVERGNENAPDVLVAGAIIPLSSIGMASGYEAKNTMVESLFKTHFSSSY